MERIATTLLDLVGLALVAAGAYYLAEPAMGRAALMVAGAVLLAGSAIASRASSPAGLRPPAWWMRLKARLRRGERP